MSLRSFLREYRDLDNAQRGVLRRGTVKGSRPPAVWVDFFEELAAMDAHGDKARKTLGTAAIITGMALFFTFFLSVPAMAAVGPIVAVLPAIVLGLFLFSLISYLYLRGKDIPNSFRLFVVPFMRVLQEELEPSERVTLSLDLRGGPLKEKLVDFQQQDPGFFSFPKIKSWFYEDSWLQGECQLVDGSRLQFSVTDRVEKRRRTKRNARGKVKTKIKHKVKRQYEVTVGLRRDNLALAAPLGEDAKTRSTGKRDVVRVRDGEKFTGLDQPVDLDRFLGAVTRVYRAAGQPAGGN